LEMLVLLVTHGFVGYLFYKIGVNRTQKQVTKKLEELIDKLPSQDK
jgi:uncharacterized protein (DUF2164 family)